ncbi:MAG: chorismate mutase [Gemmatimonadota bacterium]
MSNLTGIRGAVRVERNDAISIANATRELLDEIQRRNALTPDAVVSALFTMTPDLNADFPARAARELGWSDVALLGAQEAAVPGALDRVIRVLLHARKDGPARHVYLRETAALRPDRAADAPGESDRLKGRAGKALIVGLGLIGSSIGLALKRRGPFESLLGWDADPRIAEQSLALAAVDAVVPSLDEALATAPAVVLCVPADLIPDLVARFGSLARPGAVVMDVGSVKGTIVDAMDRLPSGLRAVGTHPIAGSELSGPGAARGDLFLGHRWILTRTTRTDASAADLAEAIVRSTGAKPEWMDAETHDASAAATIQLTYLLSAALASHLGGEAGPSPALVGPGARSMLRLSRGAPSVMAGLLEPVWERARGEVTAYMNVLERVVEELEAASSVRRMADVLAAGTGQTGSSEPDGSRGGPAIG